MNLTTHVHHIIKNVLQIERNTVEVFPEDI